MMEIFSVPALAFGKLLLTLACILIMLRLHLALWKTITIGCACIALLTGMPFSAWLRLPLDTLVSGDLIIMEVMLFGIMLLSGLQSASGQSSRLVEALERYLRWPRLRLIIFPALVGLMPMPGGALFSCPMLDAAAHGLNLSPQRKTLINYWFRHIWELAWPLYPGYILVSSLLNLPLLTILLYTSPLVLFALLTGIVFYLRDLGQGHASPGQARGGDGEKSAAKALQTVCYEALPIIITIGGAAVFGLIFKKFAPSWPSQAAFIASLACALTVALFQGRGRMSKPLVAIALNKNILGLVLLIFVIYVFKNVIVSSGIVTQLSGISHNRALMYGLFILLPMLCGMLTGVMVGYVGASFPILLGILNEAGLQEQALPLVVVAMVAGNVGQLATPLHVCMAVTLDYFKVQFVEIWRSLVLPLLVQMAYGVLWALALFFMGARF